MTQQLTILLEERLIKRAEKRVLEIEKARTISIYDQIKGMLKDQQERIDGLNVRLAILDSEIEENTYIERG